MQTRKLGRTGLKVSAICLGTMTFGHQTEEREARAIMDRAYEAGVDFFDTADAYPVPPTMATAGRTEEIVGRWLAGKREQVVLATKCRFPVGARAFQGGLSRRHILEACESSLRRLGTDWIDLYQAHAPDADTPLEETLGAMDDLVRLGKVRYIGCSNYPAWQLGLAAGASERRGWARWDSIQPRYNLLARDIEMELLPLCRELGIGVMVYNPLAGGLLTGKYKPGEAPPAGTRFALGGQTGPLYRERYWQEASLAAVTRFVEHCRERGLAPAQAAIAWVLAQPGVTAAIVGASRAEQIAVTLPAAEMQLSREDLAFCEELWYQLPRRPPGTGQPDPNRRS